MKKVAIVIPNYIVKRNKLEVMIRNNSSVSTAYIHEIETLSRLEPEKLSNLLELDKETLSNLVAVDMHRILVYDSLYVNTTIDYKDEFAVENLEKQTQEILIKTILTRIIYQFNTINKMKEKNLL